MVPPIDRPDAVRPADRPLRAVRSLAAALVCVAAAGVGHHSAGGPMPFAAVLGVFAGAAAVAWVLSTRRVTPGQLLGLLVLCQVVVHLATSTGTASGQDMTMGPAMIASHLAATAVSVWALTSGESFVWQLAERLGLRVVPLLGRAVLVPSVRQLVAVVVPRVLHDVRLAYSRSLRGPPVSLV